MKDSKTYWHYEVKYAKGWGGQRTIAIAESANKFFPFRRIMETWESYGYKDVEFLNVIEISQHDFNWYYAKLSKFPKED